MEYWKSIIEFITSLFFLAAAIIGAGAFKYKNDANIRDLYIENCKKIRKLIKDVCSNGNVSVDVLNQSYDACVEARLYLHPDISEFISKLRTYIVTISCNNLRLNKKDIDSEEHTNLINESVNAQIQLSNLYESSIEIYRKHIVQNPTEWFKRQLDQSLILNLFKKNPETSDRS